MKNRKLFAFLTAAAMTFTASSLVTVASAADADANEEIAEAVSAEDESISESSEETLEKEYKEFEEIEEIQKAEAAKEEEETPEEEEEATPAEDESTTVEPIQTPYIYTSDERVTVTVPNIPNSDMLNNRVVYPNMPIEQQGQKIIQDPTLLEVPPIPIPINLKGVGYAYIFGYEPDLIERVKVTDDEGNESGAWNVEIRMAPEDPVTREQVAAMLMRMIDQLYDTKDISYPVTDNISEHAGTWYERGLAYLASKGAFDGIDKVHTGSVTRGEVAKLVAYGLGVGDAPIYSSYPNTFEDISDSEYKQYILTMYALGYMQGESDTEFAPDKIMTRAEFCSMFNHIIGRENALLEAADGTQVTPQLYYFVDLPDTAWYTPVMLRATSAYDSDGYADIDTRLSNIRNILDNYDSQKMF
jgi:hypothetical protein